MVEGYIALGGNLGDVAAQFRAALRGLAAAGYTVRRVSPLYRSRPAHAPGPDYLNAAAAVAGGDDPRALLRVTQALERQAGRTAGAGNAPRPLDLDLIFWGDAPVAEPNLTLPHPRWRERDFVLRPLAAVMPGTGLPMEPGLILRPGKLAIKIPPVSVCHQLSWKESPKTF